MVSPLLIRFVNIFPPTSPGGCLLGPTLGGITITPPVKNKN